MRSPPPLTRVPAFPVTAGVGLMAIAVSVMVSIGRWDQGRFDTDPTTFRGQPWRLLTSALPHANLFDLRHLGPLHLVFNVYWLWVLGTLLEENLGHIRTLGLILLFAAGSAAAEYALFSGGIGLSGVGFGLFGLVWALSRRDRRFAEGMDARTAQSFVTWFFFCIVLTVTKVQGIANVAHGVGAILGALAGIVIAGRTPAARLLAGSGTLVVLGASLLGATVLRPIVNLGHDGRPAGYLAFVALQDGRYDAAISYGRESLSLDGKNASIAYNLGIAYQSAARGDEALEAFKRALDLDPHNHMHRSAYLEQTRTLATKAEARKDYEKAVILYRTITEIAPADHAAWIRLGFSYQSLGRNDEAAAAWGRATSIAPPLPTP